MRVGLDGHSLGQRATGNETYVRGLLRGFAEIGRDDVVTFVHPGYVHAGSPATTTWQPMRFHHPIPRLLFDMPMAGRRFRIDLVHLQYVRPPLCDVPCVTTVHDISFEHLPWAFRRSTLARLRVLVPWSVKRSAAILTVSEFSKADIVERYRVPPEKVHVTSLGIDERFRPMDRRRARELIGHAEIPREFVLYVGNVQPRKNLQGLLQAWRILRDRGLDTPLVIVGQAAWKAQPVFASINRLGLADSVWMPGYVSDDELAAWYSAAAAFVYPSLFEGFGLPVLEALASGVPTISSNTSSIPEVAGDAAILIDPTDVDQIASAIESVLSDSALSRELSAAGPVQASRFSWAKCASDTWDVYELVTGSGSDAS